MSLASYKKAQKDFRSSLFNLDKFRISMRSKEKGKLLTLGAFREMIEFERRMNEIRGKKSYGSEAFPTSNRKYSMRELCHRYYDPFRKM